MSDATAPIEKALEAYADAISQLTALQPQPQAVPPGGEFPIIRPSAKETAAAHDVIRALRHLLAVTQDQPFASQYYRALLGELIDEYDDPDV